MTRRPQITAVGRLLKSKHGEPRKHQVIKIDADGKAKITIDKTLDNG
jgi:hypothetical protein